MDLVWRGADGIGHGSIAALLRGRGRLRTDRRGSARRAMRALRRAASADDDALVSGRARDCYGWCVSGHQAAVLSSYRQRTPRGYPRPATAIAYLLVAGCSARQRLVCSRRLPAPDRPPPPRCLARLGPHGDQPWSGCALHPDGIRFERVAGPRSARPRSRRSAEDNGTMPS